MTKIVEIEIKREFAVSRAVAWWNYWDYDHLRVVHPGGYKGSRVLYEDSRMAVVLLHVQPPFLPFASFWALNVDVQQDDENYWDFTIGLLGIPIITHVRIVEDRADHCLFTMNYKFELSGWRRLAAPFLPRMVRRWNERVWQEDLPLKARRQKVLRHGFRDGVGFPVRVEDRRREGPLEFSLPIPRWTRDPDRSNAMKPKAGPPEAV